MYEIYQPPSSSSYQLSNNHNVKQVDQNINNNQQKTREYINSLEHEILALRRKQVFDGVEIPRCPQNNCQPLSDNNSTSGPSSSSHPITEPANLQPSENMCTSAMENTAPITVPPTLPPIHPFANVKETNYQPPQDKNFTSQLKPTKEKEVAYHTQAPIHDPKIANNVYSRTMKDSTLTISHQELLSLSPEVRQKVKDAVSPKHIITGDSKDILLN
jgi:hypothetical protein